MKKLSFMVYAAAAVIFLFSLFHFRIEPVLSEDIVFPIPTVIIDAGHGGFDGGASASDGTLEKDLNLSMAKKLDSLLSLKGYGTVMIRTEDISVETPGSDHKKKSDMYNRLNISKKHPNAIFISIHQNSFKDSSSKGAQVFYGVKNPDSKILAQNIQESIVKNLQKDNKRSIKKAGDNLFLLKNIENPCIMIECGFITNDEEASLLKDEKYQQELMLSVIDGLEKFQKEAEV